ncbi:hypothetical protein LPJ73_006918, partial [Coemansia sp. RSA 2703]
PITGMFKRRVARDLVIGLGGGYVVAEIYWHYFDKHIKRTEQYYAKHGRASEK